MDITHKILNQFLRNFYGTDPTGKSPKEESPYIYIVLLFFQLLNLVMATIPITVFKLSSSLADISIYSIINIIILPYFIIKFLSWFNKLLKSMVHLDFVILTLIVLSIFAGVSMAYSIVETIVSPLYVTSFIPTAYQIIFTVEFPERKADVIGGRLTITAIGVLAMSAGIALPVIPSVMHLSNITVNFSTITGPITGSGLTLIAVGLQRYYEEREGQGRNQVRRRRPRLY